MDSDGLIVDEKRAPTVTEAEAVKLYTDMVTGKISWLPHPERAAETRS